MQISQRRERRRPELSAVFASLPTSGSNSMPATPLPSSSPWLPDLKEEESSEQLESGNDVSIEVQRSSSLKSHRRSHFLHRQHSLDGLSHAIPTASTHKYLTIGTSRPTSFPATAHSRSPSVSPVSPVPTSHPPSGTRSKFTSLSTARHPLSLPALNYALENTLSTKRYTCSHLLALRFEDESDDDSYWEDVRSVMSLLTTSFADVTARLSEALDERERIRIQDETPSPESLAAIGGHSRRVSSMDGVVMDDAIGSAILKRIADKNRKTKKISKTMEQLLNFAPVPTHLTKFAEHVDAMATALNDAQEQLAACVESLMNQPRDTESDSRVHHSALQSYENLRRELGAALRECERGRERLFDLTYCPTSGDDHDNDEEDVPGLVQDNGDESDKRDSASSFGEHSLSFEHHLPLVAIVDNSGDDFIDDANPHLLLSTSSSHLPPPGIEQVFESDAGTRVGIFSRERSKLSREERIRIAKRAREVGKPLINNNMPFNLQDLEGAQDAMGQERSGPSPEVVQELKDVLWKVGEKRRKMTENLDNTS
jgi:hypothetical protein